MTHSSAFRPKRRRAWPLILLCAVVVVLAAMVLAGWLTLRGSLPQLDGARAAPLLAPVTIGRDALGVPTVQGGTRGDVAYASGFLHAQDRFFQMDLLRRVAAGEMAALIGPAALPLDRRDRPLRFREHAQAALAALPADERELIERYTAGVNDGLRSLRARPFEYWLLRAQPAPWRPEDTVLAVYAMYFDLQYDQVRRVLSRAALRERVPADLLAFLLPETSHWDAPLDGQRALAQPPAALPAAPPSWLPSMQSAADAEPDATVLLAGLPGFVSGFAGAASAVDSSVGSNGFAVDGAHSAHGSALLASDMHLGLSLPNIWYRISLVYPAPEGGERRITGVSLPGTPFVVAGSNGHIAWGFTNSYGRFVDLVELQRDPADPPRYRVPNGGWERAQVIHERLDVNGGASVDLPVVQTRWGPQLAVGEQAYALHWVAQDPQAINMNFMRLEGITNVADALRAAQTFGMPTQNFMVADAQGHIGWTLAGPLPRFANADPDGGAAALAGLPYRSGTYTGWQGYRTSDAYPVRVDPPSGRIWTANNRTLPLEEVAQIGDAGTDLGARATQIRNDLLALPHASERDLLAVQTDDRAFWIEYWRRVALDALDAHALDGHPRRAECQRLVQAWDGRADVNAVGYRLVRAFYDSLYEAWFGVLDEQMAAIAPNLSYRAANSRYEATMETLADHRAWIPGRFADWRAFMLDRIDHSIAQLSRGTKLEEASWGERNRSAIAHPFARMVPAWLPWVRAWLSAPRDPLPGDVNMPRVQAPAFGASERFAVSPGREQDGIFEMPGGQSGNPMSPYFLAGHETWVHGGAAPFLPGPAVHTLRLVPAAYGLVR
ncbi:penicillin acylase family protein [Paraburkholderia silvatlantica]|uniref:Penicillin amidase n=1 Tax=Paraburkholderia silvatlantica TaxID=321895 RepID=A0ABR6FFD9_9BURK|nr:penicillin acylase family protein [Paraburkholderia silvatlantica]MBB2926111.1 penicillin amidase [Paraburkholderia silvatlantica]PVY23426.1 penicillin amidase [Paraburkholderia silvatlantica]PXW30465.1 penicillin amidase [Paraburkholderia silvatlantica]